MPTIKLYRKKRRRFFTLAEVLITLTVIGVLASMTVPSLLHNINNSEYRESFKKNYKDLAEATQYIKAENGGMLDQAFILSLGSNSFRDLYANHLNIQSKCTPSTCWKESVFIGYNLPVVAAAGVTLTNGASVIFAINSTYSLPPADGCVAVNGLCPTIYVDVNGPNKGPNRIGLDQFMMFLNQDGLKPGGDSSITSAFYKTCQISPIIYGNPDLGGACYWRGNGCAAYVLLNKNF